MKILTVFLKLGVRYDFNTHSVTLLWSTLNIVQILRHA